MRTRRIKNEGGGYYHLFSRCCRQWFMLDDADKDMFVRMMRKVEYFCGVDILSYCVMDNHFHILAHIPARQEVGEDTVLDRVGVLYGEMVAAETRARWDEFRKSGLAGRVEEELGQLRRRMYDVSLFMQCLKQRFSIWYNHHHSGGGTLWQGRFGSTMVEGARSTLSTVSAYIDLNPVRAGIVDTPEGYRWSGYGAATRGNLAAMRGLACIYDANAQPADFSEKFAEKYREKLYPEGQASLDRAAAEKVVVEHGELPLPVLLRCRVRCFTSGTFLGTKKFVEAEFERHRYAFGAKRKTGARSIRLCGEVDGVRLYSARELKKSPVSVLA